MPTFSSNGHELFYLDEGEGPPILLVHGFGSSSKVNWINPGIIFLFVIGVMAGKYIRHHRPQNPSTSLLVFMFCCL